VKTGHPNRVIGSGTPASCTSAAVVRAVAKGGVITFNCGPKPVTITMTATAKVVNTSHRVVLDGGGRVTLSGGGKHRILYMNTCDKKQIWTTDDCFDQEWPQLIVQNLAFEDGYSAVRQTATSSYGGGAIYTDGDNYNVLIAGTVIRRDSGREGGGAVFFVVDNDQGTLQSRPQRCTTTRATSSSRLASPHLLPQQRPPDRRRLHCEPEQATAPKPGTCSSALVGAGPAEHGRPGFPEDL
jgi:hypothetical protein